ncbi:hypothetical protein DLH72_00990 [Candidatus Gracilibacteria bacterium]|nr:MAG: hypothetical protein DLH72_00990 [Candidatus Gracilibacteria bacterium]
MNSIDPVLIRSIYIGKKLKNIIINNKDLKISQLAEKAKISRGPFNNALNGKSVGSDNMFRAAMEAIPLTEKEIKKIFKEADLEELKYKYGEELLSSKEFTYDELLEMVKEKENLTEEQISAVRQFIDFQKTKN